MSNTARQRSATASTATTTDQIDWMRWIAAAVALGMLTSVFI